MMLAVISSLFPRTVHRSLTLDGVRNITVTDDSMKAVIRACPSLDTLTLLRNTDLSDQLLVHIADHVPHLKALTLANSEFSSDANMLCS